MKYNASVDGHKIRVTKKSGSTHCLFNVSDAPTHAIANGETVSVFFPGGGVRVYSVNGSFISMSGSFSSPKKKVSREEEAPEVPRPKRKSRQKTAEVESTESYAPPKTQGLEALQSVANVLSKLIGVLLLIIALFVIVPVAWKMLFR